MTRNGDEDLLEGDESDERLELLLQGDFDLLEDDDDELLLVHLRFSFSFGDLERLREGQLRHCLLNVTSQRLPLLGSNLSFSHYYCLPLFGKNNRGQFSKYVIRNLIFFNQSLPRFDKIQNTQILRATFSGATRKESV